MSEGSTSSSNSKESKTDDTSTCSGDANTKEPKTTKNLRDFERVKTKRLFDASNAIADTKKTITNFFVAEQNESLSDFEIPKKVARKTSKTTTTTTKKPKTTKSRSKKQPDIRKILQKQNDGVNLNEDEELQLAMELSKAESNELIDRADFEQFEYKPKNGEKFLPFLSF